MIFPEHKCGLYLEHNPNRDFYLTVQEWLDEHEGVWDDDFPDDSERQKAIETNEVWVLQWYPDTPIGFYKVSAATLERLLECANASVEEDDL